MANQPLRGINFPGLEDTYMTAGYPTENSGEIFNDYVNNIADKDCHAEGSETAATRGYAHAEGFGTQAYWRSHAQGFYTHARADSMAGGRMSFSAGPGSVAFGIEWNEDFSTTFEDVPLKTGTLIKSIKLFDDSHIGRFICLQGVGLNADGTEIGILTDARKIISVNGGEATIDRPFYEPLQPTYSDIQNQDEFIIEEGATIKIASPCEATGVASFSFGCATKATGNRAFTSGHRTIAEGSCSSSMNNQTHAIGDDSHAEGHNTKAGSYLYEQDEEGNYISSIDGMPTTNPDEYIIIDNQGTAAHAEGYQTWAKANYSHAEGRMTKALKPMAHAEGNNTKAGGESSHTEGGGAETNYDGILQENTETTAGAIHSHAEGQGTVAANRAAHAEGQGTLSSGWAAHAEGYKTKANGTYAHAEGQNSLASGNASHTEGENTTASGRASHAEGFNAQATATVSHAEGTNTLAQHDGSHVGGAGNKSGDSYQYVIGKYNDIDDSAGKAFVVGAGTSDNNRKNGFTVDKQGNVHVSGNISVDNDINYNSITLTSLDSRIDNLTQANETILNEAKEYADNKITELINGAPEALDTLNELAEALQDDQDVAAQLTLQVTTIKNSAVGKKDSIYPNSEIFNDYTNNKVTHNFAHAEGKETEAFYCSHAEGNGSKAGGSSSHAENQSEVTTYGAYAHSEGLGTVAATRGSHVQGRFNIIENSTTAEGQFGQYAHIVGNGTSNGNRSNAHTLDWNGNAWYAGSVSATRLILSNGIGYGTQTEFEAIQNDTTIPDGTIFFIYENSSSGSDSTSGGNSFAPDT